MTTTPVSIEQGLQTIPLAAITPNPQNPRKHFDQAALKDLAESIKSHGVRQPVLVRPGTKAGQFLLVCGERRLRASKLAGKENIPAIVDPNLTDRQALEIGILENLQREGVHPLDEALGYEALLKMPAEQGTKETVEGIAAKVGKSKEYVYARLKLTALIPAGREAFQTDLITAGHAVLIARLQPRDQLRAIAACFDHGFGFDAKEFKDHDPTKVQLKMIRDDDSAPLIPEKALREWIQDEINLKLKDVPWDLDDAQLLPAAGPCTTCPKRSGSNPALFAELTIKGEDTCFDAECFKAKREAFVQITIQADKAVAKASEKQGGEVKEQLLKLSDMHGYTKPKPDQAIYREGQWVAAKKGSCEQTRDGILVRGENAGERKSVCVDPSCKVHKHNLHSNSPSGGGGTRVDYDLERYKTFKKEVGKKKRAAARAQLARQMVEHVGAKIPAELLRMAVHRMTSRGRELQELLWLIGLDPKAANAANAEKIIAKAKDVQLNQFVVAAVLSDFLNEYSDDAKERAELLPLSKALGIKAGGEFLVAQDKRISEARACRGCGCTEETPCRWYANGKHQFCSWDEEDLCSNPECKKYAPPAKTAAASAKKGKK